MQETQETWVRSLGQEDPLEEVTATYSNILAWRIPWTGVIWWECLGLQAWETASQVSLRNCSEEAGEGGRLYIEVCNKEGRQSEHQRLLLIKENRMSQGI